MNTTDTSETGGEAKDPMMEEISGALDEGDNAEDDENADGADEENEE